MASVRLRRSFFCSSVSSVSSVVFIREKLRQSLLPLCERVLHLAADKQRIPDRAHETESYFVVDPVAHQRPRNSVAELRHKLMAMMPALERTFVLHVGEVMIPFEFGDAREPWGAKGKQRQDTERGADLGTNARCLIPRWDGRTGWRHAMERDQFRAARRGHDPRKVLGVREERKHAIERKGNPLLEFEVAGHAD
jgi:hypothetical protein